MIRELSLSYHLRKMSGFLLVAVGAITLVWVGQLTWYDFTVWGKDVALIFFGSRATENISLGIGMRVIHYFLIGLPLLIAGLVTLLRRRISAINLPADRPLFVKKEEKEENHSRCHHHLGYLASHPKNVPIPQECLICPRVADCMVMTAFKDNREKEKIRSRTISR